jgi:hypothetical protein
MSSRGVTSGFGTRLLVASAAVLGGVGLVLAARSRAR